MSTKRNTEPQTLPRGRHGLPRELVLENQRSRLVSAMIEVVAEQGYDKATVASVTAAAKISRRTFYETFGNREDCYRAAYEASYEFLLKTAADAGASADWPESVGAGLGALLAALANHPDLAEFFLVSPAGVGDEVADRHHEAIRELVVALLAKAPKSRRDNAAAAVRAEALAGGLLRLTATKVTAGQVEELPGLRADLVELFLRPFVGTDEAIRVAHGA